MSVINYFKNSIKRKIARNFTKSYPVKIEEFSLGSYGTLKFANWENPLVERKVLSKESIDFFKRYIQEGDLVVDIGSNVGQYTIPLSIAVGAKGKVLAFDPNPYVFSILKKNIELNNVPCEAINAAISEEEGDFYYSSSEASFSNGGVASTPKNRHGRFTLPEKVKGVSLNRLLKEKYPNRIAQLRLVKIDTEGNDTHILKSISALLAEQKPIVITECFSKSTPEQRREQYDVLKNLGYTLHYLSEFTVDAKIEVLQNPDQMNQWKHFDILALPK